ncbi:MAG: nitrous oxide reductase accessory protein NosL, partial [Salinibacter sp.]
MFGLREPKQGHGGESGSVSEASSPRRIDRRTALRTLLLAGGALLIGCSGKQSGGTPPDPVSLAGGKKCDACGMVISEHPGPAGQIFYRHHTPKTHDEPFRFDSLKGGLFPFY